MHDIKFIKENQELFDESLKKRNLEPLSKTITHIHNEYLESLNKLQQLQKERNELSKNFSHSRPNSLDNIKENVSIIKKKISELNTINEAKLDKLNRIILEIPNILDKKVPLGNSEEDNKVIRVDGKIREFDFPTKNHLDVAECLGLLDYEKAIKLSGSRFSVLKSKLALMHRALINFMLDNNTLEFGYLEHTVPELVKSECLVGTGQLPKFSQDLFKTNFNELWLIPTSEVSLTNLNREQIISSDNLPLRYTSFTNCFRSEAGSSGTDTKGLMREHQFGKVELVSITNSRNSMSELQRMINCATRILEKLEIPYRLVELCSTDTGFSSSYTIDIEVWMPGQNQYREVSSCSNCKDFQSRRMKMRIKDHITKEISYPHTLNGSSLAVGRVIVSILENFQNKDGSVTIPKILRNYMNNIKTLNVDE